jgi:glycosyltransferase involved in cell wall biosynthesis
MTVHLDGAFDKRCHSERLDGNAFELLLRRKSAPRPGEIHLDIGCGCGALAQRFEPELGEIYVGVDVAGDCLKRLAERGFETHDVRLEGRDETLRRLDAIIAGRPVGSITFLDTIQHFLDGDAILQAIGDIGRRSLANVVVSAPNVTHRDIGSKLALGAWSYTSFGLLDRANVRLFDQSMLLAALEKAGLPVVDRHDVIRPVSEQHFPETHPALAAGTPLNGLLLEAARQANPYSDTYQFVWLCTPAREMDCTTSSTLGEDVRPLLTAVVRTQGRRIHTLVEVLTCLSGQSDPDFEILVIGHKLDRESAKAVARVIEDTPDWLRQKISMLHVDDGGRTRPLNVGFAAARGRYICILDDDDIPMANWVEEFRKLDARNPGRVLRSASSRQDVRNVGVNKRAGLRAEGPPERVYASEYQFAQQFFENTSPPVSLAFPRGAFHDLHIRFDESLDTVEDWDFLLRVSAYCGVASSAVITSVYRWWLTDESSRTLHSEDEWRANSERVWHKQDQTYFIIPKGEASSIRRLVRDCLNYKEKLENYKNEIEIYEVDDENYASESKLFCPTGALTSIENAILYGKKVKAETPGDLIRVLRKGVKSNCRILQIKILLTFFSRRKRQKYRHKLRIYQAFRRQLR